MSHKICSPHCISPNEEDKVSYFACSPSQKAKWDTRHERDGREGRAGEITRNIVSRSVVINIGCEHNAADTKTNYISSSSPDLRKLMLADRYRARSTSNQQHNYRHPSPLWDMSKLFFFTFRFPLPCASLSHSLSLSGAVNIAKHLSTDLRTRRKTREGSERATSILK
jgi:hypothetical protein